MNRAFVSHNRLISVISPSLMENARHEIGALLVLIFYMNKHDSNAPTVAIDTTDSRFAPTCVPAPYAASTPTTFTQDGATVFHRSARNSIMFVATAPTLHLSAHPLCKRHARFPSLCCVSSPFVVVKTKRAFFSFSRQRRFQPLPFALAASDGDGDQNGDAEYTPSLPTVAAAAAVALAAAEARR